MESDDLIREVGIQTHSWPGASSAGAGHVKDYSTYARATGRFVRNPNAKEASAEIAAVAVIKSLWIPAVRQQTALPDILRLENT
jgi:hypothetical protein